MVIEAGNGKDTGGMIYAERAPLPEEIISR